MAEADTPGLDRRAAWGVVLGSALVLGLLGWVLVPWDWLPGGTLRPPAADEVFPPDALARAEEYAASVRPLSWASLDYYYEKAVALIPSPDREVYLFSVF